MRRIAAFVLVFTTACTADKEDVCAIGDTSAAVKAADRKILGSADPYPADPSVRDREHELVESESARRQLAWDIVARAIAPVAVADARVGGRVPRWRTWYARDDFTRMFKKLYAELGPPGREQRTPFSADAVTDIFAWNARAVEELDSWPDERYLAYIGGIDDLDGVGGNHRVGYSPAAIAHLLQTYTDAAQCAGGSNAPAFADGSMPTEPRAVRESGTVGGCSSLQYGPFPVAAGAALQARLSGTGDADLYVRRDLAPSSSDFDCRSNGDDSSEACTVNGPGQVYVTVRGFAASSDFSLAIDYVEGESAVFAPCLKREFPIGAALIKADWRRADFGQPLPTYDTSPERMATRLSGDADWAHGDGFADPGPDDIYTARLPNGNTFRLAGLHIMTKELRHWVWVTLWFSDDSETDYGADRPEVLKQAGPWRNYKMCTVVAYQDTAGGPTWCSNPYLESGPGNAQTNCIGCHQHGGALLSSEDILADPRQFPHRGRALVRDNFPADYLWALTDGDRLGRVVADEIAHYDSFE